MNAGVCDLVQVGKSPVLAAESSIRAPAETVAGQQVAREMGEMSTSPGEVVNCPDCTAAAQRTHWQFSDCPGCRARALGRLKLYPHGGPHTRQYRALLASARVTHDQVRAARALDSLHRETAGA